MLDIPAHVDHNYAYFPLRVQKDRFGLDRDQLARLLKHFNVFCRKYFHPLCSSHAWCRVEEGLLPESESAAREVLCLPLYAALPQAWAEQIGTIITALGALARA